MIDDGRQTTTHKERPTLEDLDGFADLCAAVTRDCQSIFATANNIDVMRCSRQLVKAEAFFYYERVAFVICVGQPPAHPAKCHVSRMDVCTTMSPWICKLLVDLQMPKHYKVIVEFKCNNESFIDNDVKYISWH